MGGEFVIRQATPQDVEDVSAVLTEVADWLESKGQKLWEAGELSPLKIQSEVTAGLYWTISRGVEIAGCLRYQDEDPEYWDDVPHADSSFVHRVAVRREYAGLGLANRMIDWAKSRARDEGKRFLRLDCADRPKLRAVYEKMGFVYHSVKERSPYIVIRYEFDLKKLD